MSLTGLEVALARLCVAGSVISYGDLARDLDVKGEGRIAQLTHALEALMAEDAAKRRPFRAAVCAARGGRLPAPGFFHTARVLGRYSGPDRGPEAEAFVAAERLALTES